jgi:hypothetical protein
MQATIGKLPFLCNGALNTTIEEEVFSMWLAYIHCWARDVFSMVSSTEENQVERERKQEWRES